MIEVDEIARDAVFEDSYKLFMRVDSYYNNRVLRANIPFRTGSEDNDAFLTVPERAEFRLPRYDAEGYDWSPSGITHPLAANGQRLRVTLGIGVGGNEPAWFRRATFRIDKTTRDGDEVVVECVGLLERIFKADFIGEFQPSGTFVSTLRELVAAEIPIAFDDDISDRNVPSSLVFGSSRIQALYDMLDAWPAECIVTPTGHLLIRPVLESRTAVFSLRHGLGGTIISSTGYSDSEDDYNAVIVRYTDEATGVQGQSPSYNTDATHPKRMGGPNAKYPIPLIIDSDMVSNASEAYAMARNKLRQLMRRTADSYEIEMLPNPLLEIGDVGSFTLEGGTVVRAEITQLTIPYTHDGGVQRMTVRTV